VSDALFPNHPAAMWYAQIASIVQVAIQVVETLSRAQLIYDANDLQQLIEATVAGYAVTGASITREQAEALNLLIASFAVYLNTPMATGQLKPIQVLFRQWPAPIIPSP
jgi:hypothetical protein